MTTEELISGLKTKIVEVMSFITESSTDVAFNDPVLDRKVANTTYYTVNGEYAANDLYGKICLTVSDTPRGARPLKLSMSFGEETPTDIAISSPNALYDSILAKHKLYVERSRSKSSAFTVNDALIELEQLECPPEVHTRIMEIIGKLR